MPPDRARARDFLSRVQRVPYHNEQDVCEDFVAPLLALLGYRNSQSERQIGRQIQLPIAFTQLGRTRHRHIRPDYVISVRNTPRFVLDAKAPSTNLDLAQHIDQVRSYALHHLVRSPYFVLTNATRTVIYKTDVPKPLLDLNISEFSESYDQIYRLLSVDSVLQDALNVLTRAYSAWCEFGALLNGLEFDYLVQFDLEALKAPVEHLAFLYINSKTVHIHGFAWESDRVDVLNKVLDMLTWTSFEVQRRTDEAIIRHCSATTESLLEKRIGSAKHSSSHEVHTRALKRVRAERTAWFGHLDLDDFNRYTSFRSLNEYLGINPYAFAYQLKALTVEVEKNKDQFGAEGALRAQYLLALVRWDFDRCQDRLKTLANLRPDEICWAYFRATSMAFDGKHDEAVALFQELLNDAQMRLSETQALDMTSIIRMIIGFIFAEYTMIRRPLLLLYRNNTSELKRRIHVAMRAIHCALPLAGENMRAVNSYKLGIVLDHFGLSDEALLYLDEARAAGVNEASEAFELCEYSNWAARAIGDDDSSMMEPVNSVSGVPLGDPRRLWREFICQGKEIDFSDLEEFECLAATDAPTDEIDDDEIRKMLRSDDAKEVWHGIEAGSSRDLEGMDDELHRIIVEGKAPELVNVAIQHVRRSNDAIEATLCNLLGHADWTYRFNAASVLGRLNCISAHDKMKKCLDVETNEHVREELKTAIRKLTEDGE